MSPASAAPVFGVAIQLTFRTPGERSFPLPPLFKVVFNAVKSIAPLIVEFRLWLLLCICAMPRTRGHCAEAPQTRW